MIAQQTLTLRASRGLRRTVFSRVFAVAAFACTLVGVLALSVLLYQVLQDGAGRLSIDFLLDLPSRFATRAGFHPAIVGSVWVMGITAALTIFHNLQYQRIVWQHERGRGRRPSNPGHRSAHG